MTSQKPLPLFDDEPAAPFSLVAALAQSKPITKAQLMFQRLVEKIEGKREQLVRWQAFGLHYQKRFTAEVLPLQASLKEDQRRMVLLIDELLTQPASGRRFGKVQRTKLRQLLMNLLDGLMLGDADAELEAVYARHGGTTREQAQQSDMAMNQAMLEEMLGVEIGDDHGATSPEELLAHAHAKLRERADAQERFAEEQQAARAPSRSKASATKAEAAQAKRDLADQEVSHSIREVYRKLASALHPDREPDAAERERKTRLMQRVNDAYAAKDLLTLLGLQLEIEQIDAEHLATVSPKRLAHFTQVLRDQLAELESELAHCVMPFDLGAGWGRAITPALVDQQLSTEIAGLRATIEQLRGDLVAFRDPVKLREGLKYYPLESDTDDDDLLDDDLMAMLESFATQMAPPRGKPKGRRK